MAKIALIAFAIFLLALQQQSYAGIIPFIETSITLGQFVNDLRTKFFESETKTLDETLLLVRNLNKEVLSNLNDIMNVLKNLQDMIYASQKRHDLQVAFRQIGFVFKEAVRLQKNIQNHVNQSMHVYDQFWDYGNELDSHMNAIREMILNDNIMIHNFTSSEQIYDHACKTGMSHFEGLHNLLRILKVATAQYYIARIATYDFRNIHYENSSFDITKALLTDKVQREYKEAVFMFRQVMSSASRELWSCDKRDYSNDARYENKKDEYYELVAFQKYIVSESDFLENYFGNCEKSAPRCHEINKVGECRSFERICTNHRTCKNGLADCKEMVSSKICINKDKNATSRYKAIVPDEQEYTDDLYCPKKEGYLETAAHRFSSTWTGYSDTCHVCGCVCKENVYYISDSIAYADSFPNSVVTGARLRVRNKIIHIQIQEGRLLPNGTINPSTVAWKPLTDKYLKQSAMPITWDGLREINLGTVLLPPNNILRSLHFCFLDQYPNPIKRVHLTGDSQEFDLATGQIADPAIAKYVAINATQKIDILNADVPTRYTKLNYPEADDNKFVKFELSSLAKDGGQTTIPFIDTQAVVTNPPSPLSGFGLILRRAKGYGGFLALKLYNYDTTPFIADALDLDSDFTLKKKNQ